jgi:hypothetical protein
MRRIVVAAVFWSVSAFSWAVSPPAPSQHLTVEQFLQFLASHRTAADKDLAGGLYQVDLTQRLNAQRLAEILPTLPGQESRDAVSAIADASAFLDPPPAELPADPPPSNGEQQRLIQGILTDAEHAYLPTVDVDGIRTISRYRNLKFLTAGHSMPMPVVTPTPLLMDRTTETLAYRAGLVVVTDRSPRPSPSAHLVAGIENWEGFRGLLKPLAQDMRRSQVEWFRWEQGTTGKLGVFRFSVPESGSHLTLRTSMPPNMPGAYTGEPAYQCEISIDPATLVIQRYVVRAAPQDNNRISRMNLAVEFAPTLIGATSVLLPSRAIALDTVRLHYLPFEDPFDPAGNWNVELPDFNFITHVSEIAFHDYTLIPPNLQASPSNRVTPATRLAAARHDAPVDEIERIIAEGSTLDDRELAHRLGEMNPTQRLTSARHKQLAAQLRGKASTEVLLALYDLSQFQDLPPAGLPQDTRPDQGEQGKILQSAVEFAARTIRKMPDLFATRQLARYQELVSVGGAVQPAIVENRPYRLIDRSTSVVRFREGSEVVEADSGNRPGDSREGLDTWGIFGPALESILADMLNSRIGWKQWEDSPYGRLAVFRFAVPEDTSHYEVRFCCYLDQNGLPGYFSANPGYHGEVAINPRTGAVMRLVTQADLKANSNVPAMQSGLVPVLRSDVQVDYGPVNIAGREYICPLRAVSVMTSWTLGLHGPLKVYTGQKTGSKAVHQAMEREEHSRVTAINQAEFTNYHVFRSEMRIVSDPQRQHK